MTTKTFPYTLVPARLKAFLTQIPKMGTPQKVTTRSLPELGFKSTNDRSMVGVLKSLDILSETGVPTSRWQSLRNEGDFATTLAGSILKAYAPMYETFPDAHAKSDAEITNFMRHRSRSGERAVKAMVATFRILCSMADFHAIENNGPNSEAIAVRSPRASQPRGREMQFSMKEAREEVEQSATSVKAEVTINLQIQLTDTTDAEQIDAIFESLARHIIWREPEEPLLDSEFDDDDMDDEAMEVEEEEEELILE